METASVCPHHHVQPTQMDECHRTTNQPKQEAGMGTKEKKRKGGKGSSVGDVKQSRGEMEEEIMGTMVGSTKADGV